MQDEWHGRAALQDEWHGRTACREQQGSPESTPSRAAQLPCLPACPGRHCIPVPYCTACSAGQYVRVMSPNISTLEWHPFTISSAPGAPAGHAAACRDAHWRRSRMQGCLLHLVAAQPDL